MLILLPILVFSLAAAAAAVVHLVKPGFAYSWLLAALGGLIALPMILLTGMRLPLTTQLFTWDPAILFPVSPVLLEDQTSWPFALALAALGLAVILTAVARLQSAHWRAWSFSLLVVAVGICAVLAGNPVTLLIAWAAQDGLEVFLLLRQVPDSTARERIAASFLARAAGILLLYWAIFAAQAQGEQLDFANLPPSSEIFLILAAGLRLGVLPLHLPFLQELPLRTGLGTVLRLAPAASSFMLLSRVAVNRMSEPLGPVLLILALLTALYGAWGWASADDELNGRPYWILGTAGLALAAAVSGLPATVTAWGLACLLTGGILFLATTRQANLRPVILLGALGLVPLPFTTGWSGYQLIFSGHIPGGIAISLISILLLLPTQTLLLLGFIRHAWKEGSPITGAERWVWLIYPLGLFILPLALIAINVFGHPSLDNLSILMVIIFLVPLLAAVGLFFSRRDQLGLPRAFITSLRAALSLNWLYHLLWLAYQAGRRVISWMDFILEGQGGFLWALLILALLLTLLAGQVTGG